MITLNVDVPAHLQLLLEEAAKSLGVSVEALCDYFFAREVVHT